jgi:HK97 gp10 family phage protein
MTVTLEDRLPQIEAQLRPRVAAAVKAGAGLIAGRAQELAPSLRVPYAQRVPGELRASIKSRRRGPASYWVEVKAYDEPFYWGYFVEHGTRNMKAEPFLFPAVEDETEPTIGLVEASLRGL